MRNTYEEDSLNESKIKEFKDIASSLISDIFEATCCLEEYDCEGLKSHDKFERDIFALDCARFQLEMVLIKQGLSVDKFYDYKFQATEPNDDEYRSVTYSLAALITLWKNISNNNFKFTEIDSEFLKNSLELFVSNLTKAKSIIQNDTALLYKEINYSRFNKIAL